jgi:hypothetical protein
MRLVNVMNFVDTIRVERKDQFRSAKDLIRQQGLLQNSLCREPPRIQEPPYPTCATSPYTTAGFLNCPAI